MTPAWWACLSQCANSTLAASLLCHMRQAECPLGSAGPLVCWLDRVSWLASPCMLAKRGLHASRVGLKSQAPSC